MSERVDPQLLEILVCTRCKGDLGIRYDDDGAERWLDCESCQLAYPVDDGIPIMLVEEAQRLESSA